MLPKMSMLSTSASRCIPRISRVPSLVTKSNGIVSARYFSDVTTPGSAEEVPADSTPKAAQAPKKGPRPVGSIKSLRDRYNFGKKRPALFDYSKEVTEAIAKRKPIVALETAIYTHGFPKPENLKLAKEMEKTVRDNGAVPATIAILNGKIKIGLENDQLEELAESARSPKTAKISRRDIVYRIAQLGEPLNGGTTIAGTMVLAELAGIRVFATGGLGGVHRGGESSFDISADLMEFAKSRVAVICSGMKSFLDIGRTLEVLETQGVFVGTFGTRGEKVDVPGFFSRESGHPSPNVVQDAEEAASIIFHQDMLKLWGSPLFFNPIPQEFEIPKSNMDPIVASAVEKSSSIIGKDNTPAVLDEILKQTEGRSVQANWNLVLNNAKMGAQIAVALDKLEQEFLGQAKKGSQNDKENLKNRVPSGHAKSRWKRVPLGEERIIGGGQRSYSTISRPMGADVDSKPSIRLQISGDSEHWMLEKKRRKAQRRQVAARTDRDARRLAKLRSNPDSEMTLEGPFDIVVVGGVVVDRIGTVHAEKSQKYVSNPGTIKTSVGGVAKNVAVTMQNLAIDTNVKLVSAVGMDGDGRRAISQLGYLGLDVQDIHQLRGYPTASYMAINSDQVVGGLSLAVADMEILKTIAPSMATSAIDKHRPKIVCFDGNLSRATIKDLCTKAKLEDAMVACEPTSAPKAADIASVLPELGLFPDNMIDLISPNEYELEAIYETIKSGQNMPWEKRWNYSRLLEHYEPHVKKFVEYIGSLSTDPALISEKKYPSEETINSLLPKAVHVLPYISNILLKLGDRGVLMIRLVTHPPREVPSASSIEFEVDENVQPIPTPETSQDVLKNQTPYTLQASHSPTVASLFLPISHNPSNIAGLHISYHAAHTVPGKILNSNGAGDTFFGTFVVSILNEASPPSLESLIASPWDYFYGVKLEKLISEGQKYAAACLTRHESHGIREGFEEEMKNVDSDMSQWRLKIEKRLLAHGSGLGQRRQAFRRFRRESGLRLRS